MLDNFLTKVAAYEGVSPPADESFYRSVVGALQHVCVTRPYIHFTANKLS